MTPTPASTTKAPSILLIEDEQAVLDGLGSELRTILASDSPEIRTWSLATRMTGTTDTAEAIFKSKIDDATVLVITDYDLTKGGERGLFGPSVVDWCQLQLIPVGDYSRKPGNLPEEPNLFELRVPTETKDAAAFIASTYSGFKRIRDEIDENPDIEKEHSPALVMAKLLNKPSAQSEFALYISWLNSSNAILLDKLTRATASPDLKRSLLIYLVGHVLLNAVLKYPGPILSDEALCAYLALDIDQFGEIASLFAGARYDGPFSDARPYFWRDTVNLIIDDLAEQIGDQEFETIGELNRTVVERKLNKTLKRHACATRCKGQNGGFYCPFTRRPVCQRPDCSVGASNWIPQGAQICRIERDFYDEWAPLLGL